MRPAPYVVALALLALTACAGEGDPEARPTITTAPRPTRSVPQCPSPPATHPVWPKEIPGIIPKPAGLRIDKVDRASKGNVTQVRTTVPTSLTGAVQFIVTEFPKAGFTLGRGDAEAAEADAPFQRGPGLRGLVRVFATDNECSTLWLYAVVRDTTAPYNITYTPPPSSTPLPFG